MRNLSQIQEYIKNDPKVIYQVKGIGFPGDLDLEVIVRSSQELYDFIKDLKLRFPSSIREQKIFMFRDTVKVRFLPFA